MDINQRLTEELKKQILAAETLVAVEDLYRIAHIVQSAAHVRQSRRRKDLSRWLHWITL